MSRCWHAIVVAAFTALASAAYAQDLTSGDAAKGEKTFRMCQACHAVGDGAANKTGPQLNNLFGRTPGSLDNYAYSSSMVEYGSGKVWTKELLNTYLVAPRKVVAGTNMAFPGLRKEDARRDLIAYLAQFDEGGMDVE